MKHHALVGVAALLPALAFPSLAGATIRPARTLPEAHIPQPPAMHPAAIPAGQHADGFFPVVASIPPPSSHVRPVIMVSRSRDEAEQMAEMRKLSAMSGASRARLRAMRSKQHKPDDEPRNVCLLGDKTDDTQNGDARSWQLSQPVPNVDLMERTKRGREKADAHVHAVHRERFEPQGDIGVLVASSAWIDTTTLGARMIDTRELRFARIAQGPHGIDLYAARDGDVVHVIASLQAAGESNAGSGAWVVDGPDGDSFGTQCNFMRVDLSSARGAADMTVFGTQVDVTQHGPSPKPVDGVTLVAAGEDGEQETPPATRVRPIFISVSSTFLAADREPLLSVNVAWAGKEQIQ